MIIDLINHPYQPPVAERPAFTEVRFREVGGITRSVSNGVYKAIRAMYSEDEKVNAIKMIRSFYGLGLKEAKDLCDAINRF